MSSVSLVSDRARTTRVLRSPKHQFQLRTRPWQIQPFLLAPVLPHETMTNMLFQARVVTDPIKNPLIGWWKEYYFFYVKHQDLDAREDLMAMMMDLNLNANSLAAAASVPYYTTADSIPWAKLCLKRVVEEYFRDEGEAWDAFHIDNIPVTAVSAAGRDTWLNSVLPHGTLDDDIDVDVDANADDTITIGEIDEARRTYDFMRANNLTNASYEDWLKTYGVRPKKEEVHKPELIRQVSQWTYPSNTINPTDGAPSSACSWSVAERADKDRYFREPGFIFGVSVVRPKVYMSRMLAAGAGMLNDALSWLPAIMRDDPATSLKWFADNTGPLGNITDAEGYWVDVQDLFVYGDQFVNFALTETDAGFVALPTAGLQKKYADATMADALFKAASPANKIRQDGIVDLTIKGSLRDVSP